MPKGAISRVKVHSIRALAGCCFIPGWFIVLWFLVLLTWRFSVITWSTNSLTRVLFNCRSNLPHMELCMILATSLRPGLYFMLVIGSRSIVKVASLFNFSSLQAGFSLYFQPSVIVIFEETYSGEWRKYQCLRCEESCGPCPQLPRFPGFTKYLAGFIWLHKYKLPTRGWINWSWTQGLRTMDRSVCPSLCVKARDGLDLAEEELCTLARQYTGPDRRGPRSYEILEGFLDNGLAFHPEVEGHEVIVLQFLFTVHFVIHFDLIDPGKQSLHSWTKPMGALEGF